MALRIGLTLVVSTALALSLTCKCLAQGPRQLQPGDAAVQTGFDTSHLSLARLRVWRSILDIVMAKDKKGRYLHPTLYGLYRQAESSGHVIHIDLSNEESLTRAGRFSIETVDPTGARHVATIRLNLVTIGRSYVGESARYSNGLRPFAGLRLKQRYAEVLGHELAHAVAVFQSADSLRLYQRIEKETADLDVGDANAADGDWLMRLESLKRLMRQNEEPAEAAELEIWRELQSDTTLKGSSGRVSVSLRDLMSYA